MNKLKKPPQDTRKSVTVNLAPDNLNHPGELYPEAICYLIFKKHPMFIRDACAVSLNDSPTSSPVDCTADSTSPTANDVEDAALKNNITAKGYFKSHNTFHAEENERKKKKVSTDITNEHVIDLTIDNHHRAKAATKHAEAAMLQAVASFHQSQLAALQKAQELGIGTDDLRPFILKTLNDLYSCGGSVLKSLSYERNYIDAEPEVAFLETCRALERKRPVEQDHNGDVMLVCAAGDNCVEAFRKVNKNDPVCPICKNIAHAICIAADDVKEGCLMCFVDEDL
jgi:hypothetical protein